MFPQYAAQIPEEQKEIIFSWDEFTTGMQPYYNYRYHFEITGPMKTISRELLKGNSVTIPIKDLKPYIGEIAEGNKYNWQVVAIQHIEGNDAFYYSLVNNPAAQYGTRVNVVSQNAFFSIVPTDSETIVPFVVPPGNALENLEPVKRENKISNIPLTTGQGTQVVKELIPAQDAPTPAAGNNYNTVIIAALIVAAIYFIWKY